MSSWNNGHKPNRSPEDQAFLDKMTDQIVAKIDSMPDYVEPPAPPPEREINPMPPISGVADLPPIEHGAPIGINLEKFTINYLRQDLEYRLYHSDTDDSKISGNKLVDCWMVMGFPPNPEYLPNKQMVEGVYQMHKEQLAQSTDKEFVKEAQAKLEACFEEVMSEYE